MNEVMKVMKVKAKRKNWILVNSQSMKPKKIW